METARVAVDVATHARIRNTPAYHTIWAVTGLLLAVVAPSAAPATLRSVSAEFQVNARRAGPATGPTVAMDPSGGCVIAWGDGSDIAYRRYDNTGQTIGGACQVYAGRSGFHSKPAVAVEATGCFVLVWQSYLSGPSDYVIHGQRYDASGAAVGEKFQVGGAGTDRQYHPAVAINPAGGFVVIYEGDNLSATSVESSGIFAQRFDETGCAVGDELQINSTANRFAAAPAVATDAAGNLVVVWSGGNGDESASSIFARRYDAAGVGGPEIQISDSGIEADFAPAVATDADGGFVVVWQRGAFFISHVFGRRYDSDGTPVGDAFPVTGDPGYTNVAPTVAALPGGEFVVAWQRDDLSQLFFGPGDIVAKQYASNGEPEDEVEFVNQVVAGDQLSPVVRADAAGDVLAVWLGVADVGSLSAVFARRYVWSHGEHTECGGDCDGDHRVTVAELVRGVRCALGGESAETCEPSDADGDGHMTISDLLTAVNNALHGCG
jgi:hypothetical protein